MPFEVMACDRYRGSRTNIWVVYPHADRDPDDVRFQRDCVAKVVLQEGSEILGAAGAFFV